MNPSSLLTKINHEFKLIIWVTKEPLSEHPKPLKELNYIYDGAILKMASNSRDSHSTFINKQFNKEVILSHFQESNSLVEQIKSVFELFKNKMSAHEKVLFIHSQKPSDFNKLKHIFSDHKVEVFTV